MLFDAPRPLLFLIPLALLLGFSGAAMPALWKPSPKHRASAILIRVHPCKA
jgi:hypothetical protein